MRRTRTKHSVHKGALHKPQDLFSILTEAQKSTVFVWVGGENFTNVQCLIVELILLLYQ